MAHGFWPSGFVDLGHFGVSFLELLILFEQRAGHRLLSEKGIGSHMSRLRHLGWNQCSHGLTSRPLESCHHQCHSAVCGVPGYPKGSAAELLDGSLKLRFCTTVFTKQFPPGFYLGWVEGCSRWDLPVLSYSQELVTGNQS